MKYQQTNKYKDVILVSMPWSLFSRPSIQIGALKAYLKLQFPYLNIAAYHFYLKVAETIGYKLYHSISKSTWLAETIYAAMLSPEKFKTIEKIFYKEHLCGTFSPLLSHQYPASIHLLSIDFQIINFTRLEGGRRISYTSTTDNAVKLFI